MPNRTSEAELRRLTGEEGLSFVQISERLGIGLAQIRTTCSVLGISSGTPRASSRVYGKPTNERASQYAELRAQGLSLEDIGTRFGIKPNSVYDALRQGGFATGCRAYNRAESK